MKCKEEFNKWVEHKHKEWNRYDKKNWKRQGVIKEMSPIDVMKFYQVWQVAWVSGRRQGRMDMMIRKPLSEQELKDLWNSHSIGKNFGRAIELLHGIT